MDGTRNAVESKDSYESLAEFSTSKNRIGDMRRNGACFTRRAGMFAIRLSASVD